MTHTPGPWNACKPSKPTGNGAAGRWSVQSNEQPICGVYNDCQEANARLIAAAPDLLSALEECLPDLKHYVSTHGPGPDRRLATAIAAIARATKV